VLAASPRGGGGLRDSAITISRRCSHSRPIHGDDGGGGSGATRLAVARSINSAGCDHSGGHTR
jgi:hypothetical protein